MEIIIPAYNCVATIGVALDSLINQTNQNFTVLIIDDCSSQDIYSIIKQYQDKLKIRYIRNEHNVGCGMSRQRGIDETTADYIAFFDSDDQLLPDAVETWLRAINENHPDAIYSPWMHKLSYITMKQLPHPLGMCHGKVYNVDFLRKYDIRESAEIKCKDDLYLNLQVFDLAKNVSILSTYTYLYIDNASSVTKQKWFGARCIEEEKIVDALASKHIALFKHNPLERYNALERKIRKEVLGFKTK